MIFNPWAKIKELEEELENLRLANVNMQRSREEWQNKYKAAIRCLNTARGILTDVQDTIEDFEETTDICNEVDKEPIDMFSKIFNMSNAELAS